MKRLFYFFTLLLLSLSAQAQATVLGDTANALSPGQWVRMLSGTGPGQMGNLNATATYPAWDDSSSDNPGVNGSAAPGPAYDGGQPGWNSATRKMYFQTTEHGRAGVPNWCPAYWPIYPHGCWKPTWTYDTDTNNWDIGRTGQTITGVFPKDNSGNPLAGVHVWGGITWDDGNQVLYVKEQETSATFATRVVRFCAPTATVSYCAGQLGQWKLLPSFTFPADEVLGQALGYHRTLNGGTLLVWAQSGAGTGCAALAGYKEGTTGTNGVWTLMNNGAGCVFPTSPGAPLLEGQYSTLKQVMVLSSGTNKMWRVTNTGAIQTLDNAPCNVGTTNGNFATAAEDQSTGEIYYLMCDGAPAIWKLNPTGASGSQWTQIATTATLTSTGQLCEGDTACIWKIYATPIRTYGVLGFWKYKQQNIAEYWLFKPSAGGGGDVTPPTVSITAPTAGATVTGAAVTVSATAADNMGVVGVQFKLDGANLGTEDLAAPFSITWNSTGTTNGSHTITATARDLAGNSTTSTGVSVTVSNAGGSNFATRCAAPGVRFCNGFDTAADLGGDGWGNARGRGPSNGTQFCGATTNCPTIDTTDKVSGAGSMKFTIPPGQTGGAAGSYWANPTADFSVRYGANQTYYVQFRQKITASYFPAILVDNDKIHWVSARPDLPGCSVSDTTNCFASCSENELVNQNQYGVANQAFPRWYNGCPGPQTYEFVEPASPGFLKLQNARTGVGCTYDNVAVGNRFPPTGNCFPYYPDQWVTYSYKIALGSLGTGPTGGLCYDGANPGSITPNLPSCYYGSSIVMKMGLDGQPLEEVVNWTLPVIAKYLTNPTELKYGKVWFSPYTGSATIASGAAMWFDELIISDLPIADPSAPADTTNPTVAITSPIPPTTSTTTSPITVSGTATDNIAVTSVTWTCLACVTKGGTATSSPGTSISWSIPALNLVAGTNTLNVVAHDAAGNVSPAATLIIAYAPTPTYYVATTGSGSTCSLSSPCLTIATGLTKLTNPGDTLYIRAGTYHERILYTQAIPSGTAGSPVTISAYPGETVWLDGTNATSVPLINMSNSGPNTALRYIVFDGINLDCFNVSGGDGCVGTSPAGGVEVDHLTWQNYEAKNTNSTNGLPGGFAPAHIINGNFHTFRNCNVHDNGLKPAPVDGFGGYGFYLNGDDHTIDNCLVYNNGGNGIQIFKSGTTNGANRITVKNSKIYHNHLNSSSTTAGVIIGSGAGHRIFNNEIYDNFDGIDVDYTCTDCVIANNTLYANRAQGIFLSTTVVRPIVINNVFINSATLNIGDIGASSPTYTTNRCAGTGGTANCTTSGTVASLLLNNIAATPPNFHPLAGSPLINTGTVVAGVTTDLSGTPRPQGALFDIGAYEFIGIIPPVVTILNPTSNPTLSVTSPLFSLGGTSNLP